jgi:hypothetical protein
MRPSACASVTVPRSTEPAGMARRPLLARTSCATRAVTLSPTCAVALDTPSLISAATPVPAGTVTRVKLRSMRAGTG